MDVSSQDELFEKARQLFLEGLCAMQDENWAQAERALTQSLACVPDRVSTLVNLSATLLQRTKLDEAETIISRILALEPGNAEARLNEGALFFRRKQHQRALERFDALIARQPDNIQAYLNRGMVLEALKREAAALMDLDHVVNVAPDHAPAHVSRASVLCRLQRWEAALASIDCALRINPANAQAHLIRGNALFGLGQLEPALASYEKAAALDAAFAEAYCNCGVVQASRHQWQAALENYDKALAADPCHAEALVHRGRVFERLSNVAAAAADYARAIAIDPGQGAAYLEQGNLHRKNKQLDLAIAAYEQAHAVDPLAPFVKGKLLHAKMLCCDWSGLDALRQAIDQGVQCGQKVVDPFAYQAVASSEALLHACARIFSAYWFPARERPQPRPARKEKIHVGYLCGEFREQATSFLMTHIYELHDKSRFRLVAFDNGFDDGSTLRQRIDAAFDEVVDISQLSDAQACAAIQDRQIDILVNLNGYFGLARPNVFALRPCPLQVNYLGFPGTIGAPYMDYLLADETVIPPHSRCHYGEQVVYLPHCYQANDAQRPIAARRHARADFGLPEKAFVYCCFNNNYKITPDTFDAWMRILQRLPDSVLWLFEGNAAAVRNLRIEAAHRGVAAERLVFARDLALPEHLARHALADLFLDTLPYNAHTTASDCLWAGLPLLTRTGDTFPGRVASSLLKALDLPELITHSAAQYEERAVALAQSPGELMLLRHKLAQNRTRCPLFNSTLFTQHLERAYSMMFERHLAGMPPQAFSVADASVVPAADRTQPQTSAQP